MKTHLTLILIVTLAAAAPVSASESVDVTKLEYPKLSTLEVPQVTRADLENGLRLYLVEDHELPIFRMSVDIHCGAYLEPAGKLGLVSVLGEVLRTGGTSRWTGDELDELLEGIGGSVETYGGMTTCGAGIRVLSEHTDLGLEVLAEILRRPLFGDDKIELAKVGERSAIARRNDEPRRIGNREFAKLIYGAESPYARHPEYITIEAITRDDLVSFHQTYFRPENVQMAVWGDFSETVVLEKIRQLFGDWERGTAPVPPPPKVEYTYKQKVYFVEKPDVNQSQVLIGHIGGLMTDPDYADRIVMNTIMGGGFGSRMVDAVRSREGLAYTARSVYGSDLDYPGTFYNYAATKSQSTGKAIQEMIAVIKSMQTAPPTADELTQGKDSYLNSYVFRFDTRAEVVNRIMEYDYYGLPDDFLQQVKTRIENVTADDVVAAAQKYLHPDALKLLVVGKSEDLDIPLDSLGLGPVEAIDVTIPPPSR